MKLSRCQLDKIATIVGADLRPCQTSMTNFFAKKIHYRCLKGFQVHLSAVTNEKTIIDNKQIAPFCGGNTFILSQLRIIRWSHDQLKLMQTYLLGIISEILVCEKYDSIQHAILNDEPRFRVMFQVSFEFTWFGFKQIYRCPEAF